MKKIFILFCLLFGSLHAYSQYSESITVDTTGIYKINALYKTPPKFPGDINAWLAKSFNSSGKGEGEAFVSFVIGTDGTISTIRKIGGGTIGGNVENAAVQIVKAMPRWKPARDANGKPVNASYRLGFIFGR
jgi:periplasmic protein TonB